eukprot:9621720-Alexandrium_andersonii.AAC.1
MRQEGCRVDPCGAASLAKTTHCRFTKTIKPCWLALGRAATRLCVTCTGRAGFRFSGCMNNSVPPVPS